MDKPLSISSHQHRIETNEKWWWKSRFSSREGGIYEDGDDEWDLKYNPVVVIPNSYDNVSIVTETSFCQTIQLVFFVNINPFSFCHFVLSRHYKLNF